MTKLTYNNKKELRERIEEQLQHIPQGNRIHIDKDLLEQLLFEQADEIIHIQDCFKDNPERFSRILQLEGIEAPSKYIVWSGPFLAKIDLSEVSFDDVIWTFYDDVFILDGLRYVRDCYGKKIEIDLSNTNARIDFSKSFWAKIQEKTGIIKGEYNGLLEIIDANFENVDLSNNILDNDKVFIAHCNFSNTGLKVISEKKELQEISITQSNMTGTDLSQLTVPFGYIMDEYEIEGIPPKFINTGLKIISRLGDKKGFIEEEYPEIFQEEYQEIMNSGSLDGCFMDGKFIKSPITILMNDVITDIQRQIMEMQNGYPSTTIDKHL